MGASLMCRELSLNSLNQEEWKGEQEKKSSWATVGKRIG